jgi:hypothetical protein
MSESNKMMPMNRNVMRDIPRLTKAADTFGFTVAVSPSGVSAIYDRGNEAMDAALADFLKLQRDH